MAGRIPQQFIDEIVARSDIVDVIGARVPLKKAGREYKACCPFHSEKSPSFSVSPDKQFYHCFGCGAHGTVVGFLMQYEKMEFLDAVADLAQRAGLELPREAQPPREPGSADLHDMMARALRFFQQNLNDNARAQQYVRKRGMDASTITRFALGYAPDSWDALLTRLGLEGEDRLRLLQVGLIVERAAAKGSRGDDSGATSSPERNSGCYDRFRDRLIFPIRDVRGRILGFGGRIIESGPAAGPLGEPAGGDAGGPVGGPKYMNSPETSLFHKGRELYGLFEARQARADFQRLLIVEGYMDVVRLHQAGITYAVATLGTATTQDHLDKIFRITSEAVFCFDGDRAGRQAAWRALENALPLARDGRELKFLFLPNGHDPDSLVAAEGAEAFEARINSALPLSEYLVQQLASEVDLGHIDGRAKLKALAAPLFSRMPDGIYREMLAERLAAKVGMPAAVLKRSFSTPGKPSASAHRVAAGTHDPAPMRRVRLSSGRGNLLTQAIALVIHHPAAARKIKHGVSLPAIEMPGVAVLSELLQQAAAMAHPTTAMVLERWRERPEFARLSELAGAPPMVGEAEASEELEMAISKVLQASGPDRRMNALLQKAHELGLNFEEKAELSILLQTKGRPGGPP